MYFSMVTMNQSQTAQLGVKIETREIVQEKILHGLSPTTKSALPVWIQDHGSYKL